MLVTQLFVLLLTGTLSFVFISNFFEPDIPLNTNISKKYVSLNSDEDIDKKETCSFYKWFSPTTSDAKGKSLLKNCSSCHMNYYNEWSNDKHSTSATNPLFLSIYSGLAENHKEVYPGFKLDHPNQNGNCALCHNPEAAIDNNFDIDLTLAKNTNGISCDFCHKIESVDQNKLKPGVKGLNIARALMKNKILFDPKSSSCEGLKDIRFGPIKDPVQPGKHEELKYNSLYKTSLYCAKCHDGGNGNVLIYSTFNEWVNSPAAKKGVQCQTCHMKPRGETRDNGQQTVIARSMSDEAIPIEIASPSARNDNYSIVDNPEVKHKKRPYNEVHSHSFLTDNHHDFRKEYIDLKLNATKSKDKVTVTATVENNNFGHSFPTGSPMRNAIVLIEVKDKNGKDLKQVTGPKLPSYAGDLRGKPGKLFAKILEETSSEYARTHDKKGIEFRKLASILGIPAQDWWNVYIAQDTRIKTNEKDISIFEFTVGADLAPAQITAKLIWRNTWYGLAKIKGSKLEEDLIKKENLILN
ncbi:MAG: hypothetical protein HYZ79_00430 [Candidatus Melainabacteria bacterium]|nr:hypothetical protein [Candidatus Melainabacteria bacterium]